MTAPARRLRVAVVGAGYFSGFHVEAWHRLANVDLIALCDRDAAAADRLAEKFGIDRRYTDAGAMLADAQPDVLDIVTPPATHLGLISAAARAGVNVVCQKPFCANLAAARQAVRCARDSSTEIIVHENFRFQPWYEVLREEIVSGRIGKPYQVAFRLRPGDGQGAEAYLDRQPYFHDLPRFLVRETAIHFVDVFRYLFGEIREVTARLMRLNPAIAGEDAGMVFFGFQSGASGLIDGNRLSDHAAGNRRLTMGEMRIEGSEGTLCLDGDATVTFRAFGSNASSKVPYRWDDRGFGGDCVYRLQRHVAAHFLKGSPVANEASAYLRNLEIEDAIYRSDAEGRRIDV